MISLACGGVLDEILPYLLYHWYGLRTSSFVSLTPCPDYCYSGIASQYENERLAVCV